MPKGKGQQGQSGYTPAGPETRKGAYAYSYRMVADTQTPNMQSWNSYNDEPKRGGAIKTVRKSGGGDY